MEFPASPPSGYSLPSWVASQGSPVCVVLDVSSLVVPATAGPAPAPSSSPAEQQILDQVTGWRDLYLYSGGLAICLLAMIAFRSRKHS